MNLTGMVYRPPYEANSLLLQVTQGCSHNKCTFCYMYPDVPFSVCPMEQVKADIDEAARCCPDVQRVFLEHGDAFVLSADRLIRIADAIHARLPETARRWRGSLPRAGRGRSSSAISAARTTRLRRRSARLRPRWPVPELRFGVRRSWAFCR